jgi:hypothetical protein
MGYNERRPVYDIVRYKNASMKYLTDDHQVLIPPRGCYEGIRHKEYLYEHCSQTKWRWPTMTD